MAVQTDFGGEYSRSLSINRVIDLRTSWFTYPEKTDGGYQISYESNTSASNPEQQAVLDHPNLTLSAKIPVVFDVTDSCSIVKSIKSAVIFCEGNYRSLFQQFGLMNGKDIIAEVNYRDLIICSGSPDDNYNCNQLSSPITQRFDNLRIRPVNINSPQCLGAMIDATLDAANAILQDAEIIKGRAVFPYVTLDNPLRQR
jgi:hypothetical protein